MALIRDAMPAFSNSFNQRQRMMLSPCSRATAGTPESGRGALTALTG